MNEALGVWKPIPDPVKALCFGVPKKISVGGEKRIPGASLTVEWLRLQASNGRGSGSIPGQGTRFHVPQLSSHAVTKDPTCGREDPAQPNKQIF